jgi:sugar/nucleoside kinase (ribokinase family)
MAPLARVVCLTRSAKGSVVLEGGQRTAVPAVAIKALDSNGAGDMFAGAFLYAVTQGHSHAEAAALGNHAAAQVVAQYGNRLSAASVAAVQAHFPALASAD